jgi:hypothetical protein
MKRTLTCALLKALITERARIALLDVRQRPAFEAEPGLIPGAVWGTRSRSTAGPPC